MSKHAIVIMDGAADEPLAELDGQTVLEKAHTPHTDWIVQHGRLALVRTVPAGFNPGSDVALMSVLGYAPKQYYTGRAPLEAAAQGIEMSPTDWVFRCNLVTVADGQMIDHSAGHIGSEEGQKIIQDIQNKLGSDTVRFYPGVSYRHLMVYKGELDFGDVTLAPPHDIVEQPVAKHLPRGKAGKVLNELMEQAREILAKHEVNQVRADLGENQATNIWLWGQGRRPTMDRFSDRFGVKGSVITAVDLMRGLAKLTGMGVVEVEGATGYLDTNYAGKGRAAIETLETQDLVVVHVEAPDEAGHGALLEEKIQAIEAIDAQIVGPLLEWLGGQKQWRIMVLPDHPTPIRVRTHTDKPIPAAIAGAGIAPGEAQAFSEAQARQSGLRIEEGSELMEYFLQVRG